jgi:hypothetical protein
MADFILVETHLMHRALVRIAAVAAHHEAAGRHEDHLHAVEGLDDRCPVGTGVPF